MNGEGKGVDEVIYSPLGLKGVVISQFFLPFVDASQNMVVG